MKETKEEQYNRFTDGKDHYQKNINSPHAVT
jgi:hypothetical protein